MTDVEILFALALWSSPALIALVWARLSAVAWSKRLLKRSGWTFLVG
ncbi:MAG: hypothetical protein H6897_15255 [Rhodobacteraceae bacterium]|jgi:hypothetical protein|nr:hypothetical protein [uncultured Defluviimonas sp.]MCB2125528.1 hypothetical protein [Paracoccaceae bacterium]MCC0071270.1 hypothetical protein [Paracoccaceae bacterium]